MTEGDARLKLKSVKSCEKGFVAYLKGHKKLLLTATVLIFGLALIFIGGGTDESKASDLEGEERIEARLEELCSSIEGVGECKVMVKCRTEGKSYSSSGEVVVESVVILCRGAKNDRIRKELTDLAVSLYGIGANRVKIGVLGKR